FGGKGAPVAPLPCSPSRERWCGPPSATGLSTPTAFSRRGSELLALGDADDAAAHAAARVARRLGLHVVRAGVHDDGVADDAVRPVELPPRVLSLQGRRPIRRRPRGGAG